MRTSRPLIMGILNVTPDSFSDGGRHAAADAAIRHGLEMTASGADIVDVGGESTHPGASRIGAREQKSRVLDVIAGLRERLDSATPISIDTTLAEVAAAALDAGANIINDISAGRDDPARVQLAAARAVPMVLMHMQGTPQTMQDAPTYENVVGEVSAFLQSRAALALAAGLEPHNIILDPGIGFGKRKRHNLQLIAGLDELVRLGHPVLLGASRKRFMGRVCNIDDPRELMPATCATTAMGVLAGVSIFRVHDVAANRQAADVAWAVKKAARLETSS